jgi:hypothetical protein
METDLLKYSETQLKVCTAGLHDVRFMTLFARPMYTPNELLFATVSRILGQRTFCRFLAHNGVCLQNNATRRLLRLESYREYAS